MKSTPTPKHRGLAHTMTVSAVVALVWSPVLAYDKAPAWLVAVPIACAALYGFVVAPVFPRREPGALILGDDQEVRNEFVAETGRVG